MNIRQYKETDFTRLASIYDAARPHEFYQEEGDFIFTPWSKDEYMMAVFSQSKVYVYEEEDILGFCGFTGDRINWLFVDSINRGEGVGQKLLAYVLCQLEGSARLSVWKSNERAKGLYLKSGFRITSEFSLNFQGKERLMNTMVYP
ncbi:N-acetyltransferase [Psychromonas sp. RZ22]|uniref:GNAT family N-acetyltransferase n=1 Tax=Psychromonas algarum TaxID=2555643 RepID=UPI0010689118|nr:GNAT family N-acetyltransferase [Psychromonas sp. RZ22]TEW56054.1 N-acetyltransferase [Psychromonas sp. RZ22]